MACPSTLPPTLCSRCSSHRYFVLALLVNRIVGWLVLSNENLQECTTRAHSNCPPPGLFMSHETKGHQTERLRFWKPLWMYICATPRFEAPSSGRMSLNVKRWRKNNSEMFLILLLISLRTRAADYFSFSFAFSYGAVNISNAREFPSCASTSASCFFVAVDRESVHSRSQICTIEVASES